MAKKRKAREPVAKIRTYLKYGFANTRIESYYCPRCRHLLNAGIQITSQDIVTSAGSGLDLTGYLERARDNRICRGRYGDEPL